MMRPKDPLRLLVAAALQQLGGIQQVGEQERDG